jgi:DNA-binding CsgD family transcriptional regulator
VRIATTETKDGTPTAVPERLCHLIESVGTAAFPALMFDSVERMLDAAAAAVYSFSPQRGTRMVIGDWAKRPTLLARHTGEYAGRYASADPARGAARDGCVVTTCLGREELPHPGHRALLEEAGFHSRVAALFPAGDDAWYGLHVLLPGAPSDDAFLRFAQAAPVFGSLISRHLLAAQLEARLRALCPALTTREAAVCRALLRGRSSPEIALTLGVRVSTIQTYRKRAYAKLGVATLPELFQRLL